jgi:hypothetical protein
MRSGTPDGRYAEEHVGQLKSGSEVLELLSQGLTTGQFAECLGMTLDGAKPLRNQRNP